MGRYDDNYQVLEKLFKEYKVFIDTCSLMNNNQKAVDELFYAISRISHEYHNKLVVPGIVIKELKKHLKGDDARAAAKAKSALMILKRYDGCFDVFGDKRERRFADIVFLKVFQTYHHEFNRALITQDYTLSVDVLGIMNQKSVEKYMKQIKVFKFDERGYLTEFKPLNKRENRYQAGSFANNHSQSFKQNNNFNQISNAEDSDNRRRFSNNSSDNFNPRQSYNKKSDYNDVRQDNSEKSNIARPDSNNKKQVSGKTQNSEAIQQKKAHIENNSVNINKINYGWQNNAFSSLDTCHGLGTGFSIYKDQDQNENQSDDAYPNHDDNNSNNNNNSNDVAEHSQKNSDLFTEQDDDDVPDFNEALVSGDSEKASIWEDIASDIQDNGKDDNSDSDDGDDDDSKPVNSSNSDNEVSEDNKEDNDDKKDNTEDDADFSEDSMSSDDIEEVEDSDVPEDVLDTEDFDDPDSETASSAGTENVTRTAKPQSKYQEYKARFEASLRNRFTEVTKVPDTPVSVKELPGVNSVVYAGKSKITLTSEIARGGEGIIYSTNTKFVAKIYKKGLLTERKIKKVELLLSKKLKCDGICFPCKALYNQYNEFIGYLMPRASGKELQKSLFIKPLFLQNFPNWQKIDLVKLCITILFKIRYLHQHGIIMGDINPMNILVVSPEEVYFVDTDSYQIDDFPCPVGTINYTAPEIQRKEYKTFLRTFGNEHFAVATLLFMLMLPGKPPYSHQGGGDGISNIINMNFSYPLGDESNGKAPKGPWSCIWSHLLYKVKEAFYETFKNDGKYSTEDTRLNVFEWIAIFKNYKNAIESGRMDKDKDSLTLFPKNYKAFITEDGEKIVHKGKNTGNERTCSKCGFVFQITEKDIEDCINNGKDLPTLCNRCASGAGVYKTMTCCDCGKRFAFTQKEYKFYEEKEYALPKRCPSCRAANRKSSGWKSYDGRSYGGGRRDIRDNKGCFLNMLLFGLFLH